MMSGPLIPYQNEKDRKERMHAFSNDPKVSADVNHEKSRIAVKMYDHKKIETISHELALYGYCFLLKTDDNAIILDPSSYDINLKNRKEEAGYTWVSDPPENSIVSMYLCFHDGYLYQWWQKPDTSGVWVKVKII